MKFEKVSYWLLPLLLFTCLNANAYVWINERFQCKIYLNQGNQPFAYSAVEEQTQASLTLGFHNSFIKYSPSLSEEEKMYIVSHTPDGHPSMRGVKGLNTSSQETQTALSVFMEKTQHDNNRLTRWVRPAHTQRSEHVGGVLYLARNYEPQDLIALLPVLGANDGQPFSVEQNKLLTVDLAPIPFQGKSSGLPTSLIRRVPHVVAVDRDTGKISLNFSSRNQMCLQIHYPFDKYDGQSFHLCYSCSPGDGFETDNSRP